MCDSRRLAAIDVERRGLDDDQPAVGGFIREESVTWRTKSMPLRSRGDGSSRSSDCEPSTIAAGARGVDAVRVDDAAVVT